MHQNLVANRIYAMFLSPAIMLEEETVKFVSELSFWLIGKMMTSERQFDLNTDWDIHERIELL